VAGLGGKRTLGWSRCGYANCPYRTPRAIEMLEFGTLLIPWMRIAAMAALTAAVTYFGNHSLATRAPVLNSNPPGHALDEHVEEIFVTFVNAMKPSEIFAIVQREHEGVGPRR